MSNGHRTTDGIAVDHHRAEYILERGTWRATCKGCGWRTADSSRRGAAALFRRHSRNVVEMTATTANRVQSPNGDAVQSEAVTLPAAGPADGAFRTARSG